MTTIPHRRWFLRPGLALAAIVLLVTTARAGILDVAWTEPTTNIDGSPLTDLASYRVYYGADDAPCPGSSFLEVASSGPSPAPNRSVSSRLTGLSSGTSYYVSVTAVDTSGNESDCSSPAQRAVATIDFAVSPTGAANFGTARLGSFVERTFTVQNMGGATVSGTVSTSAPFTVVSGSALNLVEVGATQAVIVRFSPTVVATASANVTFTANGGSLSRLVTGVGIATDPTSPTVAITAPTSAATYRTTRSSQTLRGTASDNVGVTQVAWANSRGGSGPATGTTEWTASGIVLQLGVNVLTITARDAAGNTATARLTVTRTDGTPPVVSITAPTSGSTVSGNVTVSAIAADNVGVVGVQFRLDGIDLGPEVTAAPYAILWKTSTAARGTHALTAVARDAAGNSTISGAVTVTVSVGIYRAGTMTENGP
jgi:hypothetical protein